MFNRLKTASPGDLVTAAFALFSLFLLAEGVMLGVGKLSVPEPGFFPFIAGAFLFVLTLAQLVFHKRDEASDEDDVDAPQNLPKLAALTASLFVYCAILDWAGFLASTFLLSAVLLFITSTLKWYKIAAAAAAASGAAFVIFKVLLGLQLPSGHFI